MYIYTIVLGCFYDLQIGILPSLCSRFSISVTAGNRIAFLELGIWNLGLVIIFEFQGHCGKVPSFLERRRDHKGPNLASKEVGRPQPCF
jgi:hypothetical protein